MKAILALCLWLALPLAAHAQPVASAKPVYSWQPQTPSEQTLVTRFAPPNIRSATG